MAGTDDVCKVHELSRKPGRDQPSEGVAGDLTSLALAAALQYQSCLRCHKTSIDHGIKDSIPRSGSLAKAVKSRFNGQKRKNLLDPSFTRFGL